MDKLWIFSTLFNNSLNIEFRFLDEIIYCLNATEDTVFILVLVYSKIRLSWNKQTIFIDETPNTKTKIIASFLHKIRRCWRQYNLNSWIRIFFYLLSSFLVFETFEFITSFLKQFLWQTKRKTFSVLFENLIESDFLLRGFSFLINRNVSLS